MPTRAPSAVRYWFVAVSALALAAAGCTTGPEPTDSAPTAPPEPPDEVRLLAIGDSVLDFHAERSTPEVVGAVIDAAGVPVTVENRAIGGSCLVNCGDPATHQIPARYVDGDWTHILVSGGGNDLPDATGGCSSPDPLMSADLSSGAMVELVDRMPSDAVVLLYRYSAAVDADDPRVCSELVTLMDRYEAFAAERANVVLADAGSVTGPDTPELWADHIHPNEEGSRMIGQMIAELILRPAHD